jgi:hypothetical protein
MCWKLVATVLACTGGLLGLGAVYDQLGFDPSAIGSRLKKHSTAIHVLTLAAIGLPGFILARAGVIPTTLLWDMLPAFVPFLLAGLFALCLLVKAIHRVVRILPEYRGKHASKEWRETVRVAAIVDLAMSCATVVAVIGRPAVVVEWLAFGVLTGALAASLVYVPLLAAELADRILRRKVATTTLAVLLLLASSLIQIWAL